MSKHKATGRPSGPRPSSAAPTSARHRAAPKRSALVATPAKAIRNTVVLSGVAAATTGIAVTGGVLSASTAPVVAADAADSTGVDFAGLDVSRFVAAADPSAQAAGEAELAEAAEITDADRAPSVSRSADRREAADPVKEASLATDSAPAVTGSEDLSEADPRDIARALLPEFGFGTDQFGCLDSLYIRESNWNPRADNPTSSAYGIPQALPGSKMASAGADWATNPVTQIRWGLGYIRDRYGSPCGAWGHSQARGWY